MGTTVQFKRTLNDVAALEPDLELAIGTTTFAGDGNRMFVESNGIGILLSHHDAKALLAAAKRVANDLGYQDDDA